MELNIYQIDAFANRVFEGNPASVVPLDKWLDDTILQKIAIENNQSETAFFVKNRDNFHLRWFTPNSEIDLCGHATLAAAYVIFEIFKYPKNEVNFKTLSGNLKVVKNGKRLKMDFPTLKFTKCTLSNNIKEAFNIEPIESYKSLDYILLFKDEDEIINLKPNFELLKNIDARGVIVTAKSKNYDFVNRFFIPKFGINEDPVTGSAYTQLAPLWSKILKKDEFISKQLSKRGGIVYSKLFKDRVEISGFAVKYLQGFINI